MSDVIIRREGQAGWITLNRPQALNALTWDMCLAIAQALDRWQSDPAVTLVMIDGAGPRAFCAGGDIAQMYATATAGDLGYGQRFWRDEYRLNRRLFHYPKPVVTFLHGYTMGGGVGVGCHARHRIVDQDSRIALPECGIGLVPDVGGSLLLARAPGHLGRFLGVTGYRMDGASALHAGFADHFIPAARWPALQARLAATGDLAALSSDDPVPPSTLADWQPEIDALFAQDDLAPLQAALAAAPGPAAAEARRLMAKNAPLAMAVTLRISTALQHNPTIEAALDHEFRYTFRSAAQGDFIEGIRAAIIDRDFAPRWRPATAADIAAMTAPLGADALIWEETA